MPGASPLPPGAAIEPKTTYVRVVRPPTFIDAWVNAFCTVGGPAMACAFDNGKTAATAMTRAKTLVTSWFMAISHFQSRETPCRRDESYRSGVHHRRCWVGGWRWLAGLCWMARRRAGMLTVVV